MPVQDVFLPYCQDVRHPQDTLFFYVEHDFRFHHRDDERPEDWLPLVAGEDPLDVLPRSWEPFPGAEPLARSGSAEGGGGISESQRRGRFSSMLQPVRRSTRDGDPHDVSPEFCDCIAYCNAASREGLGDLVWLGWNGGHTNVGAKVKYPNRISFGSQLMALTARGAKKLQEALKARGAGHIDLKILDCLEKNADLRSCSSYVCPPIGGFSSQHTSLNLAQARPGPWNKGWCYGGTNEYNRTEHYEPKRRCIAKFQWDTPLEIVTVPEVPDVSGRLHWRTLLPPRHPSTEDETARRILTAWGWLDEHGAWLGWAWTRGPRWWRDPPEKGWGKGRDRGRWLSIEEQVQQLPPNNYWRTIQLAPEGPPCLEGRRVDDAPMSALGLLLATACVEVPEHAAHESRPMREKRQAQAQYMQRHFTDDADQALRVYVHDPSRNVCGRFWNILSSARGASRPRRNRIEPLLESVCRNMYTNILTALDPWSPTRLISGALVSPSGRQMHAGMPGSA